MIRKLFQTSREFFQTYKGKSIGTTEFRNSWQERLGNRRDMLDAWIDSPPRSCTRLTWTWPEEPDSCFRTVRGLWGYAARVMRGVIIDRARSRNALRRSGSIGITNLRTSTEEDFADERELTAISAALDELAKMEPALSELVDLKFFCGFSFAEIARMRGLSERTVQRQWEKARIYLHRSIRADLSL